MLLQVQDVHKGYGGVRALRGVNFELRPGEVHALVGENGAGKSTLMKIIAGAESPDAGTLRLAGRTLSDLDPLSARRLGIAVIYQQPALFPDLTVAENIAIVQDVGPAWRRVRWRERRKRAALLLKRMGADLHPEARVGDLSMPEQQLVEIARAIGEDARVVIMDEPTASLGEREVQQLFHIVDGLKRAGTGVVYVSHRLDEIFTLADRVTVLRDGENVATRPIHEISRAELIRFMVGRQVATICPKQTDPIGDAVLEVRGLTSRAAGLNNIDLAMHAGEIVGLAGLVGAGRTEFARVLFGLSPADGGQIMLRGQAVRISSPERAVHLGLALVPEDRRRHGVVLDLPVAANISLAVLRRISGLGRLNVAGERELARRMVKELGVRTASLDAPVASLSGGNQQKVAVARWLATKPVVLILDEPTQGVDVGAKAEIHRLIRELAAEGMAILLISSDLPEILNMSDRIAVMRGGTIAGLYNRADATPEKVLALALGHAA